MINEKDLIAKVEQHSKCYRGQMNYFYEAVGLIMVGRLFGWRVMRLTSSRRCWRLAAELFGDPKEILPERGKYVDRSLGLAIADKIGDFRDVFCGSKIIPHHKRNVVE